ncbi:MAG TPA: NAD(P)-binding domain-containing protein [Gemmatimonadaceae bacterium]
MRIGILGTAGVAQTLGTKLVQVGHQVRLGGRHAANERAAAWAQAAGAGASTGTFADAAAFGELVMNCTAGTASLEALRIAGPENLNGKILIDVANPLDFSRGMPPTLTLCNTTSLGEEIQRAFPDVKVVKALNTVTAAVMVEPSLLPGDHDLFVCGNDAEAKATVSRLLRESFGWRIIHDLGDISAARGTEMMMAAWVRLMLAFGTPRFNWHIQR